ncbi:sensor histidine kinase [Nonomuraea angiospora]|uniref:histidine kinase n=1 Tax=Nonomuraea angiospora TaxID=46172 RepID=A0ABR9LTT0_9ACTN|nr:HAMP domain-containing sensor histidine kinase [Nonomuraea angiospora]MBE1584056.1 signal transduction histidine kinase [Nonomuraea angiospora]
MSCWHRYSIRCRLAVVAGLVTGLLCTTMAVFIVVMSRQAAVDFRTDQLFSGAVSLGAQLRHRVPDLTEIGPGQAIQVFDPAGTMVAATRDLAGKPPMTNLRPDPDAYATTTSCDTRVFPDRCMIVLAYPFHREGGVWQLNTAVPDVPWYVGPELIIPLATGCVLLVAAAAAGSYRIVGKTLQPVDAIGGNLAQITASGDLRHRVPVPKYRDELRGLAETANQALERAQMAVDQQLRFASDASHDLRSPLTAMRIRIEEALIDPRQADWQRTADALLDSVERMQALIGDLLQEARLDAGVTGRHEPIDLTELVAGELERRLAKTDLRHRLTPGVMVDGSRIELSRLLNNLLDNAERHADSAVTVTLTLDGEVVTLEVSDDGEGIAPEHREVIFQRFTRLEASRARDPGGTGLGLPIARQIAQSHGGTLTAQDSPRGARFVLRLPERGTSRPPSG